MDSSQENYFQKVKNSDRYFYSKNFSFEERGGYFLDLNFSPKNLFYRLLASLGILKIKQDILVSAVSTGDRGDYCYAYTQYVGTSCRAILTLEKTEYTVRVTVPSFNLTFFKVDMSLYRMHH